jgi:hypothetical protein
MGSPLFAVLFKALIGMVQVIDGSDLMLHRLIAKGLLVVSLLSAQLSHGAIAQTSPAAAQTAASLDQIKQAVFAVVGEDCRGIDVQGTKVKITLILVNCAERSSHARDVEAGRIADAVTKAVSGKSDFQAVVALHVDYVVREENGKHQRRIDGLDFFKNPQGKFQSHMT